MSRRITRAIRGRRRGDKMKREYRGGDDGGGKEGEKKQKGKNRRVENEWMEMWK